MTLTTLMTRAKHLYHLFVRDNHAIIEAESRKPRVVETVLGQISDVQVPLSMGDGEKVEVPTIKHENTITDRRGESQGL